MDSPGADIPAQRGPLPAFRAMVAAGELAPDPSQDVAAERLQTLWARLCGYDPRPRAANGQGLFARLLRREHGTGARVIANDVSASGVRKNASHWERSCAGPSFQSHPSTAGHYPYVARFASVANFGCESHFECVGRIACAVIDPGGPDWRASQIPGSYRPVWEHQRWCLVVS